MDIQNVSHVIQFMVPPSLSVWTQHLGRAGRSGESAVVILLVEPSVYKLQKTREVGGLEDPGDEDKHEEEDDEDAESDTAPGSTNPTYQKKVEEAMRKWIEAVACRRDVADAYFNNPPRTTGESFVVYIIQYLMIFRIICPLLRSVRTQEGCRWSAHIDTGGGGPLSTLQPHSFS